MAARPKREGPNKRAEQRAATLKLILDTAEDLFAQLGYFGVTIKDVADRMGIHPALIHYYFDGKKALFDAVFQRRVEYAVEVRTAGLDAYEAEVGDHPTLEGALRAYYDGAFDVYVTGDEGWRNFGRIFSQGGEASAPVKYQVQVRAEGERSTVSVLTSAGAPETSANAQRIVRVLTDDLK